MSENNYNLRPLWDAILEVYKGYADICIKHNLKFYVTGGTAIGALRHKGFIPWDDDFDVIMPRPDYIKFMEIYSKELPAYLKAVDFRNTKDYPHDFGKVCEVRDSVIEEVSDETNLDLEQGIYIDVIPIDGMPKATVPFYIWQTCRMAWRKTGQLKNEPLLARPFWWILSKILRVPTTSEQEKHIAFEQWLSKCNFYESPAAEDFNANPRRRLARAFNKETYGTAKMVPFENIQVPIAQDTEHFMRMLFGDWKVLPPIEGRKPSHQAKSSRVLVIKNKTNVEAIYNYSNL